MTSLDEQPPPLLPLQQQSQEVTATESVSDNDTKDSVADGTSGSSVVLCYRCNASVKKDEEEELEAHVPTRCANAHCDKNVPRERYVSR